jgi:hypothetical protein
MSGGGGGGGQQFRQGTGVHTWWGFSPALDLHRLAPAGEGGRTVLLLGCGGDARHLLRTLGQQCASTPLHVYVLESTVDAVARIVLLLHLARASAAPLPSGTAGSADASAMAAVGVRERAEMVLEVSANTLVRAKTWDAVVAAARRLAASMSDPDAAQRELPLISVDALKFRDRDLLEVNGADMGIS